eukprot:2178081-Amphidinium_carterae.1
MALHLLGPGSHCARPSFLIYISVLASECLVLLLHSACILVASWCWRTSGWHYGRDCSDRSMTNLAGLGFTSLFISHCTFATKARCVMSPRLPLLTTWPSFTRITSLPFQGAFVFQRSRQLLLTAALLHEVGLALNMRESDVLLRYRGRAAAAYMQRAYSGTWAGCAPRLHVCYLGSTLSVTGYASAE